MLWRAHESPVGREIRAVEAWTDYVNNGYTIGNVETSTPSHMVIRPAIVMVILLVELFNSDH